MIDTPSLRGVKVTQISSNKTHRGVVTSSGEILLWGENNSNQISKKFNENFINLPKKLKCKEIIKYLKCGSEFNLAVTTAGKLLSWGNGDQGMNHV